MGFMIKLYICKMLSWYMEYSYPTMLLVPQTHSCLVVSIYQIALSVHVLRVFKNYCFTLLQINVHAHHFESADSKAVYKYKEYKLL